ncbi:MAG: hypothetical protein ACKPJJ_16490, partial [Planctomycetaceae bacterium]
MWQEGSGVESANAAERDCVSGRNCSSKRALNFALSSASSLAAGLVERKFAAGLVVRGRGSVFGIR